jgi:hypothetical protein
MIFTKFNLAKSAANRMYCSVKEEEEEWSFLRVYIELKEKCFIYFIYTITRPNSKIKVLPPQGYSFVSIKYLESACFSFSVYPNEMPQRVLQKRPQKMIPCTTSDRLFQPFLC